MRNKYLLQLLIPVLFLAGVVSPAKSAGPEISQAMVSQCAAEVRAPGSYVLIDDPDNGKLVSATGATDLGSANVNDCLADKLQLQYASFTGGELSGGATELTARKCRQKRNESIFIGVILTAGVVAALGGTDGAIIGGVLGTAAGVKYTNDDYQKCLGIAGNQALTVTNNSTGGACTAGRTVLQGGNGYCFH